MLATILGHFLLSLEIMLFGAIDRELGSEEPTVANTEVKLSICMPIEVVHMDNFQYCQQSPDFIFQGDGKRWHENQVFGR